MKNKQFPFYDYKDKNTNIKRFVNYMLSRTNNMFMYHNLPETIPAKILEKQLQQQGYTIFFKYKNNDYYTAYGGLGGEPNVYLMPTIATIAIPALQYNVELEIDKDCVVISNDTFKQGLLPLLQKYATLMNETDITILMSLINTRMQTIISSTDDNTTLSAKHFIDDIEKGKLGVIAEPRLFEGLKVFNQNHSNNMFTNLIEMYQYFKGCMYNDLGLDCNFNMKRERITATEVELNTSALYPLVDDMLYCRRVALEKINELYGLDITVEFNASWDYRAYQGEPIVTGGNVDEAQNNQEQVNTQDIEQNTNNNVSNTENTPNVSNSTDINGSEPLYRKENNTNEIENESENENENENENTDEPENEEKDKNS